MARQPVFEPSTGFTGLQTVRTSQASADQRAGRAGRLGPGRAIRLWRKEQTAALPRFTPPEILNADLSSLVLDLADWGVSDPTSLRWLDQPPQSALQEAYSLLRMLGAITEDNKITGHGKAMRSLPLPPRFSHMVLKGRDFSASDAERAAQLALVFQERGAGGHSVDLNERVENLQRAKDHRSLNIKKLRTVLLVFKGDNPMVQDEPLDCQANNKCYFDAK